jgi:hypothetical protein
MSEDPSRTDLARLNTATYTNKTPEGYNKIEDLSDMDIHTYKHNEKNHYVIASRGTDFDAPTIKRDLKTDLKILIGQGSHSKQIKKRVDRTEEIVKQLKEREPNTDIHLTGHSLGGFSAQQSLVKSAVVRDGVKSLTTFNAGTSPLQGKGMSPKNPAYGVIAGKSIHLRIASDGVSENAKSSLIGTVKSFKSKKKPSVARKVLDFLKPKLNNSVTGKIAHFAADKILSTLESHSINHFIT